MFQTEVVDYIKTNFLYYVTFFFFSKIVPFFEILWKNIAEPGRPQLTIWHKRIACWIPKFTNTHSEYVILIAFSLPQRLHERASVYIACLVLTNQMHRGG